MRLRLSWESFLKRRRVHLERFLKKYNIKNKADLEKTLSYLCVLMPATEVELARVLDRAASLNIVEQKKDEESKDTTVPQKTVKAKSDKPARKRAASKTQRKRRTTKKATRPSNKPV
jgi:hypothetical protein